MKLPPLLRESLTSVMISAALGLIILVFPLRAAETSKRTISARVVSVAPDASTAVINRGEAENVIPGSPCVIRPNRGKGEADIEWDVYFAKGVVQTIGPGSSVVKLTVVGPSPIQPQDYCEIEAEIPPAVAATDLGQIALNDIVFQDRTRRAPLFTLKDLIKDPSPRALEAIYDKLLQEILSTPAAVLDERYQAGAIPAGRFSGMTRPDLFRSADRKQVEDFIGYRAWFGGQLINYDWLLIDSFVNWAETGGKSGDGERRRNQAGPSIRRAEDSLIKEEFTAALAEYNEALLIDPENDDVKRTVETVRSVLDRRRALEEDAKDVSTRYALGVGLFNLRLKVSALREFLKAKELGLESIDLEEYLGNCYGSTGQFAEALKIFEALAARSPDDPDVRGWVDYARESANLVRQGPNVASLLAVGRAWHRWGAYDEAIAKFNAALEIAPLDKDVWLNIGRTVARRRANREEQWAEELWHTGKFVDALGRWKSAIGLCEASGDMEDVEGIIRKVGGFLFDAKFYEQAIPLYQRILAKHPQDSASHFEIARCYLELKNHAEAVKWAHAGLALKPEEAWGYNILGAVHKAMGDLDRAAENYQKAVELTPQYAAANGNLAEIHALKGDYGKAEDYFRRALEIDNAYGSARNGLVALECVRETSEALRSKPEDSGARIRLAKALFDLGDYDRAMAHLEGVVESGKDLARAREQLGYCLIRKERYQEGKASLEESFRLDPKPDAGAWVRFAEASLLLEKDPSDPAAQVKLGEDSHYWESYDAALAHFHKAQDRGLDVVAKMELARKGQEAKRQMKLASESFGRGQFEKAAEYAGQALALYQTLGALRGQVDALLNIGWSQAAQFKHDEALRSYDAAGRAAAALKRDTGEADYLSSVGSYHFSLGRFEKALECYTKAGELWHRANALLSEADISLPSIARLKWRLGDPQGELAFLERALLVQRKAFSPRGESSGLIDIASALMIGGDFSKAAEAYRQARDVALKYNLRDRAMRAYAGLGWVSAALGDLADAQRSLERYLDMAVALGLRAERANALVALGWFLLDKAKNFDRSMPLFEEARDLSRLTGDRETEGVALANIALGHSRQGRYQEALPLHEEALKIIRESHNRYLEMQGLNEKGETLFGLKEYDQALDCQLKARELAVFLVAPTERWQHELAAGKSCEAKGDTAKAIEFYKMAAETVKGIRSRIASETLSKGFGEQEKPAEVYTRLIRLLFASGQEKEAFRYIEESKSKIVSDAFGGAKPETADPALKQTLLAVDKMENKKEAVENERREELKKPENARDPKKLEILTRTLAETESEFNQLMLKLKFQNSKMFDAISISPAALADVQRQVPKGTVFLEYFISPQELYILGIGKDFFQAGSATIAEPELNTLVNRFLRQCQEPPSGGVERFLTLARQLYGILIAPVEDIVEQFDTIVIIPYGILYYFPFHALVRETAGRPEHLVERKRICYTTSATFADILNGKSREIRSFLGFGNPAGDLLEASREVESLKDKIFKANGKVLTLQDATKDAFYRLAKDSNILHLATHGEFGANPLDSYLLFAGDSKADRQLSLLEVAGYTALRKKNSLVFLSACQTATEATKSGSGSELITLSQAFAMAGAPTLIATLWKVEENSTRLLAERFYDELMNKKKDKLDALRSGQISLIRSAEYSHPFYWASFLMIGSWR